MRGPCPEPRGDECCAQHRIDRAYDEWYEIEPEATEPPVPAEGWLYFIGPAGGYPIKVGWTSAVARRLADLQGAHWLTLICHGAVPATMADEAEAHDRLWDHHVRGEWFGRAAALELLAELEGDGPG